jgi:hypothetical protein
MTPTLLASGLALAHMMGALLPLQDDMAFGVSIAPCVDVTGDGRADVALASPRVGRGGEILLVSGLTGFTMSRCAAPPGMQCFGFRLWGAPNAPTGTYFLAQAYESVPLDSARRILVAVDAAKHAPAWIRVIEDGFLEDVELDCAFDPARDGRPWSWLVATKVRARVSLRSLSMSTGEPRDVCSFEIHDDDKDGELVLSCGSTPASSGLALVSYGRAAALVDLEEGKVVARFDIGRRPDVQARIRSNAITTDIDGDGHPDVALAIEFEAAREIEYWGTVKWYSGRSGAFVREVEPALRLDGVGHRMSVAQGAESDGDLLVSQYTTIFGSRTVYVSSRTGKRVGTPVFEENDLPGTGWEIVEMPDVDGDKKPEVLASTYAAGCQGHPNQQVRLFASRWRGALWSRSPAKK